MTTKPERPAWLQPQLTERLAVRDLLSSYGTNGPDSKQLDDAHDAVLALQDTLSQAHAVLALEAEIHCRATHPTSGYPREEAYESTVAQAARWARSVIEGGA